MMPPTIDWTRPWGIVSDAHGNPAGLDVAVRTLRDRGVGTIFFLGDAVGYLPFETEVLARLRDLGAVCLCGNHEAMLLDRLPLDPAKDRVYGLRAAGGRLSPANRAMLGDWPERLDLDGPLGRITMVHGGLNDPLRTYVYPDSDLASLAAPGRTAVFMGHTHRPFVSRIEGTLIVNVGSCGLPRDIGNSSSCAYYDPLANNAEIMRVPFDADAVIIAAQRLGALSPSVRDCLLRTGSNEIQ